MKAVLGLRAALILLVLIAIAPVYALVIQSSLAEQRERVAQAEAGLQSLVELGAAHQERLVEGARQMLTAIANSPPVYRDDLAECASYMRKLQAQYPESYGTFGLLDPQGQLTCRAAAPLTPVSSADRPFFRKAVETGRFSVGEFAVSRASGRRVLTFGLPVYREGTNELRGVAYVAADLSSAAQQLRAITVAPEMTLLLTDAAGIVMAAAGPHAPAVGAPVSPAFLREAIAEGKPKLDRRTEGQAWLYSVRPVGRQADKPLFVAGLVSTQAVVAPAAAQLRAQLGALALISLLAAGLAWLFAGKVLLAPMRRLLDQVESLASESQQLDRPPLASAIREFGDLHRNFHEMARQLAVRAIQRDGAMAEMNHQKTLFESVLEGMAEGVLVVDRRRVVVHANGAARRLLPGLAIPPRGRAAALDPAIATLYSLDGVTECPADAWPSARALGGEAIERFRHRVRGPLVGAEELVIEGSAHPLVLPGEQPTGAVVVFTDISEAYAVERALKDSEQRYRSLFESNPHPMWVFDLQTLRFLTVNDAAVAHYGYTREEFLAMTVLDIRPRRDGEIVRSAIGDLEGPIGRPRVWLHRLKDGRLIHAQVTSHALEYDGRPARMVLAHDITEQKLAQEALSQLNESLERRVDERTRALEIANSELESFSYSVSHDLRAPLQVIDGFSRTLVARHAQSLDNQARHYLERIRENTRRMSQLIDDMLALGRVTRADLQFESFDLALHARRTVEQLRHRFPERDVIVEIEEPLPCKGDPRLLAIVMENLIGNAWKFTSRKPEARIRVGHRADAAGQDVFFVADNGAGFDMDYADKLFKAFQRLHAMSDFEGTGIGLATVHRIVARHGGRVWAHSGEGEGATFEFTLG